MYLQTREVVNLMPAIISFWIAFYTFKKSRHKKQQNDSGDETFKTNKQLKKETKLKQKEENENIIYPGLHQAGLPLAEGAICSIKYQNDKFIINGGGADFTLSFDKITDVTVKTDIEIQKAYVSSIGGAVGGSILFGPLGAIVGGRAKEKKSTSRFYYFIITYLKEDKIEYISFDVTSNFMRGQNIAKKFKDNGIKAIHTINL